MSALNLSRGSAAAIGAYFCYSLAAPLTRWLIDHGDDLGAHGGDAVSFCNLLTVGNVAAALVAILVTGHRVVLTGFAPMNRFGWLSLMATATLSVVTPAMFFFALQRTSVSNVILLSRAGPIFYAIMGSLVIGRRITVRHWTGYGFIAVAILLAMWTTTGSMIGSGDALALAAAFGAALVSIVGREALDQMGLGSFVFARNVLAAIGFATIALVLFGPMHFADLALPSIVAGVSVYGIIVVGLAQLLWFFAIGHATPSTVGGWSFVSPLSAVVLSIVILHEQPHPAQWFALVLVLIGMGIAASGPKTTASPPTDAALAAAAGRG